MSSYCDAYSQNCAKNCCDVYRQCPYYYSDCYSYYSSTSTTTTTALVSLTGGAAAGVAVGVIVFFVGIGLLIYFCCRKRNQIPIQTGSFPSDNQTTIIIPNQQQGGYGVAQPFGQPMGQPYGTPMMPQPGYPQPYGQPNYGTNGEIIINQM